MFESKNSVLFDTIPVVAGLSLKFLYIIEDILKKFDVIIFYTNIAMGSAIMVISSAFLSMMINSCQKFVNKFY